MWLSTACEYQRDGAMTSVALPRNIAHHENDEFEMMARLNRESRYSVRGPLGSTTMRMPANIFCCAHHSLSSEKIKNTERLSRARMSAMARSKYTGRMTSWISCPATR
eukprot:Amastigsp_a510809_58.p6 type:complete len:108 gc:universal Amastigsp_a510809_58:1079-756(-)